jgi:hypothetical protein
MTAPLPDGPLLTRLFPRQFDNAYRGLWAAVWLFVPVVVLRLVMGFNSIVMTRKVAVSADGIPLDRFDAAGAQEVVVEFALLGLFNLLFGLIGIVALVRYRAMIPAVFLLFLGQQLAGRALNIFNGSTSGWLPSGSIGSFVVFGLLAATALGLVLSLWDRRVPSRA